MPLNIFCFRTPKIGDTIWESGQRMIVKNRLSVDHPTHPAWFIVERLGKTLAVNPEQIRERGYGYNFFYVRPLMLFGSWEEDRSLVHWKEEKNES